MNMDKLRGALLGLAVGDALGTTVEFKARHSFKPLTDMVGGGPFALEPGEWTDDTSMALCLAESLVERGGFNAHDQMDRYLRWFRDGHYSVKGFCFDIGNTTREALVTFELGGQPFAGPTSVHSAGNGSIMRLAPVPMAYAHDPVKAIELAKESSRTTHGAAACVAGCRYLAALIVGAINGEDKESLLSERYSPVPGGWAREPLSVEIDAVAAGSFKRKSRREVRGTGYVVDCLEAALWAFHTTTSFEEGALAAVNLGDDADTTGAVYGQIAGAYYGAEAIPAGWLGKLAMRDEIERLIEGLAGLWPVVE